MNVSARPCPLCGAPARVRDETDQHWGWVQCSADCCCTLVVEPIAEAIKRWNTRQGDQ